MLLVTNFESHYQNPIMLLISQLHDIQKVKCRVVCKCEISANASNIIHLYVGKNSPTKNTEELLKNLFEIVHCFRKELYPKDMTWDNSDINKTIEKLQVLEQVAV